MKLWLDDKCETDTNRLTPPGWIGVKTALQACRILARGGVTEVSLDHDLGPKSAGTGYLVAKFIERRAFEKKITPLIWNCHSDNPEGKKNIIAAMNSAERFWQNHGN